mgnify:CR=1 FL=1
MTDIYKKENVNKKLTIKSRDWLHREQCTIFEESDAPGAIINQIIKDNLFDMQCMINILERDTGGFICLDTAIRDRLFLLT